MGVERREGETLPFKLTEEVTTAQLYVVYLIARTLAVQFDPFLRRTLAFSASQNFHCNICDTSMFCKLSVLCDNAVLRRRKFMPLW